MDPLTAIGLASSILAFIDFGTKLATAAYEVYESKDGATTDVVNAKVTNADLLGLIDRLRLPTQAPCVPLQDHEQRLESLKTRCSAVAEELNKKLQGVSLGNIGNPSAWKSFKIAIMSMWKRKDIAELQTQLAMFTQEMQLHILVDLRIGAHNLELSQKHRFDSLDEDVKVTAQSIETRLTSLQALIEKQGAENKDLHQKTRSAVKISTNEVLGNVSREGDATRASIAKTEAVIIGKIQQLSLHQQDAVDLKPLLVDSRFVCDPKHFISRMSYVNKLSEGFKSHRKMLLIGLGGVGKSQIAIDYANQLRKDDPSLSFVWVYGSTQSTFVDSYRKILGHIPKEYREDQLKIIRRNPDATDNGYTDEEALRLVCEWFSSTKAGRWLMVLDNADSLNLFRLSRVGDVRLKATLPQSDSGRLLITSRTQQVSSELIDGGQECVIQVKPMTPKEAETMFRTFLQNDGSTDDHISELASKLDFLPLAIRQATSFIANSGGRTTISSYSQRFDTTQFQSRLLKAEFSDSTRPEDIANSVVVTWQISFREIERERPFAAEMLAFIGVLSREGIPDFLLKAIQPDELEFDLDMGILIQYSLVDQDARKHLLSLHRLVQLTIKLWLADTKAQTKWHEKALAVLRHEFLKAVSASDPQRRDMATCRALRIHVIEVCRYNFESEVSKQGCQELMASLKEFDQLGLTWLQAGDVTKVHHTISVRRTVNTGHWLFSHPTYQQWISSPGQLLWITGVPGSGKTVLSSYVIDHFIYLESMPPHTHKPLFFYFRYDMESGADSVFRELLRQFCSGEDQIPSAVEEMNTRYESTAEMPSITDLLKVFRSVVEESKYEVIVVIDALDECSILSLHDMLKALQSLMEATITNLHLFISSRPLPDIDKALYHTQHINMTDPRDQDLYLYVTERVGMFSDRISISERTQLEKALLQNPYDTFLWIKFAIEILEQYSQSKIFQASLCSGQELLQQLSAMPHDLQDMYQLALRRLMEMDHRPKHLVNSVFVWILYAKRILSLDEFVQAVGAPENIQKSGAEDKQMYIKRAGGPFIRFEHGSARLSHLSVGDFLQSTYHYSNDNGLFLEPKTAHLGMTTRCLDYLLSCTSTTISDSILTERPLLRYAAEYWHQHLKECSREDLTDRIIAQCAKLFDPKTPQPFLNWLRIYDPEHPARGLRLDATIEDFSPRTKYISLCGVHLTGTRLEGTKISPESRS